MAIFALAFVIVVLAMLGMAIGVLCGRPPIRGSCGGVNKITGSKLNCLGCGNDCDEESCGGN